MGFGGYIQQDRSDAELLAAHVAGDRDAFGELFGPIGGSCTGWPG